MKKVIVVSLTAFAFFAISATVLFTSCQKKNVATPSNSHHLNQVASLPGQFGGDLWYFGTPHESGGMTICTQPCGPYCHTVRNNGTFYNGINEFGYGNYSLTASGNLLIEIDITNLNPAHINAWTSSAIFQVPLSGEVPYQSIVETYNAAGIYMNIPHYFMPVGNWPVTIVNTGNPVKKLEIVFTSMSSIGLTLSI